MKPSLPRLVYVVFGSLALLVPLTLVVMNASSERFDQKQWLSAGNRAHKNLRGSMIEDLSKNILKRGLSENSVLDLLGKPDRIDPPSKFGGVERHKNARKVWSYSVGQWSGFRVDEDFLAVAFDARGEVLASWHWQS